MNISIEELIPVLSSFNPWWRNESITDLPTWQRSAFHELFTWTYSPPAPRAVLLSGARQVGKTTLLMQAIESLLGKGVPPGNILYITFDHPLIKMAGIDAVLAAWRERELKSPGDEYLFFDEAQFIKDWEIWVKHQVDFNKQRRIILTASATPLLETESESLTGRLHTIKLATLSFYEYLQLEKIEELKYLKIFNLIKISEKNEKDSYFETIKKLYQDSFSNEEFNKIFNYAAKLNFDDISYLDKIESFRNIYGLPRIQQLSDIFDFSKQQQYKVSELASSYIGHFNEYLLRGGFPQITKMENLSSAQKLLREDIIDKVLKRDMIALFGVRNVIELEHLFLYLCMHDGGTFDMEAVCSALGANRTTVQNHIKLLEDTHLIYRLLPFGYGKDILRAKYKIYIADPAISPAVLLRGKDVLNNAIALSNIVEAAVFKHLYSYFQKIEGVRLTYWRNKKQEEVDVIAEMGDQKIAFEIKYRSQIRPDDLQNIIKTCQEKSIKQAFVITKTFRDFGLVEKPETGDIKIMKIPATLFCYWLGAMEQGK